MTLQEIEKLIGYNVDMVISEYELGDYGDPDDWTGEQVADAERDGDFGDRLRTALQHDPAACRQAMQTITEALIGRWNSR